MKKLYKWLLGLFLVWRAALLLVAFLGMSFAPFKLDYLGGGQDLYLKNSLLWGWANFDGVHYLAIAKQGYLQFQQAFFPFYPLMIRSLAGFFKNYLFSGLLISHLAFLAALFLFHQLIRLDFKEKTAKRSLFYLLIFPTAFYFGSVYTESLFLMLVLGSFYAARKRKWLLAGVLGGMAGATRFVGIFLFPALVIEWWQEKNGNKKKNKLADLLPLSFIFLSLLTYMYYLQRTTGDPLYFIHVLSIFGPQRTGGRVILLYQVFWRYLKMICTTKADVLYFAVWLELIGSLLFLFLTIFSYFRLRLSYFVFMFLAYITPTLTGSFSSMPRYVLVLFPGFIALSLLAEKCRWLRIVYPAFAIILTIVSVIFFTRGFWVA